MINIQICYIILDRRLKNGRIKCSIINYCNIISIKNISESKREIAMEKLINVLFIISFGLGAGMITNQLTGNVLLAVIITITCLTLAYKVEYDTTK